MKNSFARLFTYLKFICRRERLSSPLWMIGIIGFATLVAAIYPQLLQTEEEIVQMAVAMSNPAMVAMMGKVYGMEALTQASVMSQECLVWMLITAAIMNIFLVNRHTRADEEAGRLEMFRALSVGHLTGSAAIIKFAFAVNALIGAVTAGLLILIDIGGTTVSGAFSYGFAIAAVGFFFAALTLLLAQLFSTTQGVTGAAFAVLGISYILRAVGDVNDNVLSSISPLGLAQQTEAFYTNDFVPLLILYAESIALILIAMLICNFRDHGTGIIPMRKGKAHASRFLCTQTGFALRLCRGNIIGWGIGLFALGASYGSVATDIGSFVENNAMMQQVIGTNIAAEMLDNYVAMIFLIMSMVASVPIILTVMKIHSEEKHGRLEQIFARAVAHDKLYISFIAAAFLESIVMMFLLTAGLFFASGGKLVFGTLMKAGFCYLLAIWVMAGIAVFLIGALPKATSFVWLVFAYSFIVLYLGKIMDLPKWLEKLSPFGVIPQLPVQEFNAVPLAVLTVLAVILTILGILTFKKRDIY